MYRSGTQVRKTRDERGAELGKMDYLRRGARWQTRHHEDGGRSEAVPLCVGK